MILGFQTEPMNYGPVAAFMRMLTSVIIFSGVFYDQGFYNELCGELAIPANPNFLFNIIIIEVVASQYPLLANSKLLRNNGFLQGLAQNYIAKNIFIFVLKLTLIFGQVHRIRFYIHVLII